MSENHSWLSQTKREVETDDAGYLTDDYRPPVTVDTAALSADRRVLESLAKRYAKQGKLAAKNGQEDVEDIYLELRRAVEQAADRIEDFRAAISNGVI